MIKSLYSDYFQKSGVFLFPIIGTKRGGSNSPIQIFTCWEGKIKQEDRKLVCLYHLRKDQEFINFEKTKLLGNRLFHDFKMTEDNKGVYIFDLKEYGSDWDKFMRGRYSKLSPELKKKIKEFYLKSRNDYVYVESFLHPDRYFDIYSNLLGVQKKVLQEVGELCGKPDMEKETLKIEIRNLEIKDNAVNL